MRNIKQLTSGLIDTTFSDYLRTDDNDPFAGVYKLVYIDSDMWMFNSKKKPLALFEVKHNGIGRGVAMIGAHTASMEEAYNVADGRPFFLTIAYTKDDNDPNSKDFGRPGVMQERPKLCADPFAYVIPANKSAKSVFDNNGFTLPNEPGRWFKKREFTQLGLAIEGKLFGQLNTYYQGNGRPKYFNSSMIDEASIDLMIKGEAY